MSVITCACAHVREFTVTTVCHMHRTIQRWISTNVVTSYACDNQFTNNRKIQRWTFWPRIQLSAQDNSAVNFFKRCDIMWQPIYKLQFRCLLKQPRTFWFFKIWYFFFRGKWRKCRSFPRNANVLQTSPIFFDVLKQPNVAWSSCISEISPKYLSAAKNIEKYRS